MTDHADTIRRFFSECQPVQYHAGAWGPPTEALEALVAERQQAIGRAERLQAKLDASYEQRDRYVETITRQTRERQQAIDERDAALRKAALIDLEREHANEYRAQMNDMNTRLIQQRRRLHELEDGRGRTVREAEARCEQAIDALRTTEEWAHELGHDELAERLRAALLNLGEHE